MGLSKRCAAEFLGTLWLVLGGCGAAVISAKVAFVGVGILGVALAFGLTVLTGMYALGAISGGHFNPAITLGLATAGRFPRLEVFPYWLAQVGGAIVAALLLYLLPIGHMLPAPRWWIRLAAAWRRRGLSGRVQVAEPTQQLA